MKNVKRVDYMALTITSMDVFKLCILVLLLCCLFDIIYFNYTLETNHPIIENNNHTGTERRNLAERAKGW